MDVELVFLDKVKEKVERSLEDFEVDFVFGVFQVRRVWRSFY